MSSDHANSFAIMAQLGRSVKDRLHLHCMATTPMKPLPDGTTSKKKDDLSSGPFMRRNAFLCHCDQVDIAVISSLEKKYPAIPDTANVQAFRKPHILIGLHTVMQTLNDAVAFVIAACDTLQEHSATIGGLDMELHSYVAMPYIDLFNSIFEVCQLIQRVVHLRGVISLYKLLSADISTYDVRIFSAVHDYTIETSGGEDFLAYIRKRTGNIRVTSLSLVHGLTQYVDFDIAVALTTPAVIAWDPDFTGNPSRIVTSPKFVPFFTAETLENVRSYIVYVSALFPMDLDGGIYSTLQTVLHTNYVVTIHGGEVLQIHSFLKEVYRAAKNDRGAKLCSSGMVHVLQNGGKEAFRRKDTLMAVLTRAIYGIRHNPLNARTKAPMILALMGLALSEVLRICRHWGVQPSTRQKLSYYREEEWDDAQGLHLLLVLLTDLHLLWSQHAAEASEFATDILTQLYKPMMLENVERIHARMVEMNRGRIPCVSELLDAVNTTNWEAFSAAYPSVVSHILDSNYFANQGNMASALSQLNSAVAFAAVRRACFTISDGLGVLYHHRDVLVKVFLSFDRFLYVAKLAELFPRAFPHATAVERGRVEDETKSVALRIVNGGIGFTAQCLQRIKGAVDGLYDQVHGADLTVPLAGTESRGPNPSGLITLQVHLARIASDMQNFSVVRVKDLNLSALSMFLSQLWISITGGVPLPNTFYPMKTYLDAVTQTLHRVALYFPVQPECEILAMMPQIRQVCTHQISVMIESTSPQCTNETKHVYCQPLRAFVAGDSVRGVSTIMNRNMFEQMNVVAGVNSAVRCVSEAVVAKLQDSVAMVRRLVEARALNQVSDCSELLQAMRSIGACVYVAKLMTCEEHVQELLGEISNTVDASLSPRIWPHYTGVAAALATMAAHKDFRSPDMRLFSTRLCGFKNNAHCVSAALPLVLMSNPLELARLLQLVSAHCVASTKKKGKERNAVERATLYNALMWVSTLTPSFTSRRMLHESLPVGLIRHANCHLIDRMSPPTTAATIFA
eukprot:PhM_4_TR7209/c0_g1_i1/m.103067